MQVKLPTTTTAPAQKKSCGRVEQDFLGSTPTPLPQALTPRQPPRLPLVTSHLGSATMDGVRRQTPRRRTPRRHRAGHLRGVRLGHPRHPHRGTPGRHRTSLGWRRTRSRPEGRLVATAAPLASPASSSSSSNGPLRYRQ
ncbi:uncharacterized protein Tco025E_00113 [Trypanosoma conorhini]|uniref:Uncharacterized protein n=1 Tax=Trypanosoma conorhini TaxID=83891 RepID=A0A422QCQ6_9TRYP|nr:uncharacterized protein Tco025E_00113 [Trypanosoma conorhini]RNF27729.1 hypothetical protein Tco025E_00113 [Trypanosoma conorhini]